MNKKTRQFVWHLLTLIMCLTTGKHNLYIILNKILDWYNYLFLALSVSLAYYSIYRIHKTL